MSFLDDMRAWAGADDFKAILTLKQAGDTEALHEASLTRVMKHIGDAETSSLAVLTSQRASRSAKDNATNFKALQTAVRGMGLGFIKLEGHWKECQTPGTDYAKCDPKDLVDITEPSLFIPKITLPQAKSLMKRYEQDAVLYAGPEFKGAASLVFADGTTQKIGKFTPGNVGQAFSRLKGKSFFFEWVAQSHIETLIEEAHRKGTAVDPA